MRLLKLLTIFAVALCALLMLPSARCETLRGFGKIEMKPLDGGIPGYSFICETPENARVLLHKLARDMSYSATVPVAWEKVKVGGAEVPVLVRPGFGSLLVASKDRTAYAYIVPATSNLESAFAPIASSLDGARFYDENFRYPMYLDKFSGRGVGCWYPYVWGDKNSKGHPNEVDDHFAYAKEHDLALQPNNGGPILRTLLPKTNEYDRPFHFAQWLGWTPSLALLSPGDLIRAGKDFNGWCSYYGQVSFGGEKLLTYRNWVFQQTVKEFVNNERLVDWLDPNGEVGPENYEPYWDFSENNRSHFADWLRTARGYTLPSLSKAWYGDNRNFASWKDVPIPLNHDMFGWEPDSILASARWTVHSGSLEEGLERGYQRSDCDDHGWVSFQMPGTEVPSILWNRHQAPTSWFRGTLEVPQEWLKKKLAGGGRVYLNSFTLTNSANFQKPERYWINGREIGALSQQPGSLIAGSVDVTDVLKAGTNTVVFAPRSMPLGTMFLAAHPMEKYPFGDSHLNARWFDWREYISACIEEHMENTLKAIRGIDPNRSVKMHAAKDKDLITPLEEKYGGFPHNTGDEAFFRPWDKRFAYVRGVPASAETSGSVDSPEYFKRWLGWYNFTGLNAVDYFHNIQSMMYSPCAELWKEYLPYFKLANRRDIKKPDIALMESSMNNRLLPRNIPLCFDLGRGDLQPLGYSYVYVDEGTFKDGLVQNYPVIFDCATALMSKQTVDRIKSYVEAGGTFVAMQETGRHTPTQRDAWPISDLTGFKVKAVRPMVGTVNILFDQPLLAALAGKSFYNRGVSIDYSDYNYANQCLALEPSAPDTQVIARYDDGVAAIGMRKIGKGRVIVLGSPFWRDSYDKGGVWWPSEGQCAFLEDLFHGLGLKPLATADSHKVWREHYLANNGTEEYLALHNPYAEPQTCTVNWTTVNPAQGLYDPKNGKPVPGVIDGTSVRLEKVSLAGLETLVVAAPIERQPQDSLKDWFAKLALWSRPSSPGVILERPNLPVYELDLIGGVKARQVNEAELGKIDLAALALQSDPGEGFSHDVGLSPEAVKEMPGDTRFVYHCAFDLPASWKPGDSFILNLLTPDMFGATVDVWINGKLVAKGEKTKAGHIYGMNGGSRIDIGANLLFGKKNTIVFTSDKNAFQGLAKVLWRPAPSETISADGSWNVQSTEESGLTAVNLPGKFEGLFAEKRDVQIPASWKDGRVYIQIDLPNWRQFNCAIVNDKVLFLPVNYFSSTPVTYTDITPFVNFGGANVIILVPAKAAAEWKPGLLEVNKISLQRVPNSR